MLDVGWVAADIVWGMRCSVIDLNAWGIVAAGLNERWIDIQSVRRVFAVRLLFVRRTLMFVALV